MCNAFFVSFLILHIFINVSYSDEIENRHLNGESTTLESCKYQLGQSKNTIHSIEQLLNKFDRKLKKIQGTNQTDCHVENVDRQHLLVLEKEINNIKSAQKSMTQQMETEMTEIKAAYIKISKQLQKMIADVTVNLDNGAVFIRWGRTSCGNDSDLIYTGQVGGGHYTHSGTSVNRICLPNDPDTATPLRVHTNYDYLYGAEYELFNYNKPNSMKDGLGSHDIPCAVCYAKGKMSSLMIPGRKRCYTGWTQQYNGILMSGHYQHISSSEYTCMDGDAEALSGGAQDQDGALFYPVGTRCGSLKCPPYSHDTEVPCVVCTK